MSGSGKCGTEQEKQQDNDKKGKIVTAKNRSQYTATPIKTAAAPERERQGGKDHGNSKRDSDTGNDQYSRKSTAYFDECRKVKKMLQKISRLIITLHDT